MQLPPDEQSLYQLGRRLSYFHSLEDLKPGAQRSGVESVYGRLEDTLEMLIESLNGTCRGRYRPIGYNVTTMYDLIV